MTITQALSVMYYSQGLFAEDVLGVCPSNNTLHWEIKITILVKIQKNREFGLNQGA